MHVNKTNTQQKMYV